MPEFGDVGIEVAQEGTRHVMFIANEQVVILRTSVSDDDEYEFYPGAVTYSVKDTKWGLPSDLEIAEMLDIFHKDPQNPPELLK